MGEGGGHSCPNHTQEDHSRLVLGIAFVATTLLDMAPLPLLPSQGMGDELSGGHDTGLCSAVTHISAIHRRPLLPTVGFSHGFSEWAASVAAWWASRLLLSQLPEKLSALMADNPGSSRLSACLLPVLAQRLQVRLMPLAVLLTEEYGPAGRAGSELAECVLRHQPCRGCWGGERRSSERFL